MKIVNGDVVFLRNGSPAVVKDVDVDSGKVVLDYDLAAVQKQTKHGLKNHLDEQQRESYNLSLNRIESDDKKEEIKNLYELIQTLRNEKKTDPKVIQYLENELMYRMHRDQYVPPEYKVDLRNVPKY